jgi:hypothetical protein
MDGAPGQDQATWPRTRADDDSSFDEAIGVIEQANIKNAIITKAPEERFRLGTWSVIGLVVNRMIGTLKVVGGYVVVAC